MWTMRRTKSVCTLHSIQVDSIYCKHHCRSNTPSAIRRPTHAGGAQLARHLLFRKFRIHGSITRHRRHLVRVHQLTIAFCLFVGSSGCHRSNFFHPDDSLLCMAAWLEDWRESPLLRSSVRSVLAPTRPAIPEIPTYRFELVPPESEVRPIHSEPRHDLRAVLTFYSELQPGGMLGEYGPQLDIHSPSVRNPTSRPGH